MAPPKAYAVIGAGYGDEGKGLMVDALAAGLGAAVVVRSNGGAQAGHTVALTDGRRHVFHHVAAGAFAGAATHLSRHFVHHPMLLEAERDAVANLGGVVDLSADPRGLVTTPWDMLINQAAERARGPSRHGSCGLGFGETIERNLRPQHQLTVADLVRPDLRTRLEGIRGDWTPQRLAALGVNRLADADADILAADAVLEIFLEDCARFAAMVAIRPDAGLGARGPVVFEGAQGLMLDQAIGAFPYVTRSHTGLVNVAATAREAGLDVLEAVYVTRAYATRHGAGPLAGATEALDAFAIDDPTNAPNAWQGTMRYATLDLGRLEAALAADFALADLGPVRLERSLAVTCLDQARGPAPILDGAAVRTVAPAALAGEAAARLGLPLRAEGWGATRAGVRLANGLVGGARGEGATP